MKIRDIGKVLDAELLTSNNGGEKEFDTACSADLMSDILAHASPGAVLLTGLITPQAVRTAEMAELVAIVFVRKKRPPDEVIALGDSKGIPIWLSNHNMFETCGKLYVEGIKPARID
jgi:predicted transcriptional regulator